MSTLCVVLSVQLIYLSVQIIGEPLDSLKVNLFYHRVYESFLEQIDANDNGISQYEGAPKYKSSGGICGRVGRFNPHWNEAEIDPDERFKQAMKCVGGELEGSYLEEK